MAGKIFIFDLDDTLIDNVHDYAEPILDTAKLIVKTFGRKAPHVDVIIALEHEIDSRRVKEINPATGKPFLYSMERFPGTMVEVYREIAKRAGTVPDPGLEKEFYAIGLSAFDETRYSKNIHPNAKDVYNFLRGKKDSIELLTKGDARVQRKKITALESAGIHIRSHIVDNKNPDGFLKIAYEVDQTLHAYQQKSFTKLYSVGNSYASDIKPALEAGFKGILIPVETWDLIGKMDDVKREARDNGVLVFDELTDIITHYEEL